MAGTNLPRVPEGVRDLMKAYTKEVLREKPTNLYEFSSDYFERIASGRGHHKVLKYEPPQSYETIMKNRIRHQVPISLVFNIIPDNLTELIKKFIKAVLREKPENLLIFAVEYFQRLRTTHSPRMEYSKYSAFEKYNDEKGSSFAPQEKCTCGRILSSRTRDQEYMNAIFIIQRQCRRYLAKKRVGKTTELKKENRYDSVEYMNAIRIIQRYCRQYLRKRTPRSPLNSNKTHSKERKLSLTNAAFIIQRAFRNMVKTRRAKRHINAELDQCDEVNDNASEAASYTSASTALLSTESACEHIEFGGSNYEEGVHQQTIREDEEVENDYTNKLQDLDNLNEEMDNRKKRGLYGQKSRRDIHSEPNSEKPIASSDNSEDFPTDQADDRKSIGAVESIKTSVSHKDSAEISTTAHKLAPENSALQSVLSVSNTTNILKNIEESSATLDAPLEDNNESNTVKSIKESISQAECLETDAQSHELKISSPLKNHSPSNEMKNSEESIKKSISQMENLETAPQSDELVRLTQSNSLSEEIDADHSKISQGEEIVSSINSIAEQEPSSDPSTNIDRDLQTSDQFVKTETDLNQHFEGANNNKSADLEHSSTPEGSIEDKPTSAEGKTLSLTENNIAAQGAEKFNSENDYLTEVNSLQTVLNTMKEKYNQDEEIFDNKKSTPSATNEEGFEQNKGSTSNMESDSTAEAKESEITEDRNIDQVAVPPLKTESADNTSESEELSNLEDKHSKEDTIANGIGKSIIIHSILPGEDDYELPLSSEILSSPDNTSNVTNVTESTPDIDENTEEIKNIEEKNIDEPKLKQDSSRIPDIQTVDELIINSTTKEDIQVLERSYSEVDSSIKPTKGSDENKNRKQIEEDSTENIENNEVKLDSKTSEVNIVAELQLKSFKTDSDGGNWYDVYNEPSEDSHTDNNTAKVKEIDVDSARFQKSQSVEYLERRPNYIYGEESTPQEPVKPKQSIAFFISFDGDDGKTSFKIPKRFLRQTESTHKILKKHHIKENDQVLSMDPIIPAEEDINESDVDIGYQQFGIQKLQTIHELNENESSNELKSLIYKSDDYANEFEDQEISMVDSDNKYTEENYDNLNAEAVDRADSTEDRIDHSLKEKEDEIKIVEDNETDQSHDISRKKSAQIIQRAFKNYLRKKLAYNEDISKGTSATSLITIIPNTNESQTPEVSFNEGELSDEMTVMNPEVNSTKPECQDNSMLVEVQEEKCIKKSVSRSNLSDEETKDDPKNEKEDTQLDAMDEATSKLMKPEEVIEKMSQRRSSETREKLKEDFQIGEPIFGEPIIRSMSSLQEQNSLDIEDGDIIVYNRLQRDETRESSAQSESVVFGDDDDKVLSNDAEAARSQLSRHYTIAGEDPRVIFRSVTIDETVRYIENDNEDEENGINNSMSFCLDDETSENIRKKMMAYSLSEGDSDYCDPSNIIQDDFHIDTAMTDAMDTSTETESTIVSAATKIQAGARGFLARRRLRRASAGTKSSTQDTKASFGNDAISESLERFIEEEAAKKIQVAYRLHSKKQKKQTNNLKSASLESSLAAKRQTLQRGDALRNDSNSTPEDENSSSTSHGQLPKVVETQSGKDIAPRSKRSTDLGLKWPAVRQNSMPVQIDCEVLRPIPKHMRRRIKSAENGKNKKRK
ncbi:myosin-11 [Drosophila innubila]|uniref:myosin-11 n=1 Tax=Drosophila innubila TaxID=198719 RepID=UPI00148C28B4|nr:myosin-11 [Drosophila innubila]